MYGKGLLKNSRKNKSPLPLLLIRDTRVPKLWTGDSHKWRYKPADSQRETILVVELSFITDWWFWNGKEILFFLSSLPIMHTAGSSPGRDVGRHYQIYSDSKYARHKQSSERYLLQERSKTTQVICGVISWARWYLRPHWVSELNALTRSPCSVPQTCFNCESKRFWYEIYWAGKGKEE